MSVRWIFLFPTKSLSLISAATISIFLFGTTISARDLSENNGDYQLSRGSDCMPHHPTNVNLRFEEIELIQALQLLAGFSCNEILTNYQGNKIISTDYTETPWTEVVAEICKENSLNCWTKNEVLYVQVRGRVSNAKGKRPR